MGFRRVYFAFSLPVIAFLTFYWFRQSKKTDKNTQSSQKINASHQHHAESTVARLPVDQSVNKSVCDSSNAADDLNKLTYDISTLGKSTSQVSINEKSICSKSVADNSISDNSNYNNNKSIDEKLLQEKLICDISSNSESNLNKSVLNQQDFDKKNYDEQNSKQKISQGQIFDNRFHLIEESTVEKLLETVNPLSTCTKNLSTVLSSSDTNLNDYSESKLDQQSEKLENQFINKNWIDNELNIIFSPKSENKLVSLNKSDNSNMISDITEDPKFGFDLIQSKAVSNETKEIVDTSLKRNSTLNSENFQLNEQFTSMQESNDNTFNTANDSSLNATINTSNDDWNLMNASISTLCSQSNENEIKKNDSLIEKLNIQMCKNNEEIEKDSENIITNSIEKKIEKLSTPTNSSNNFERNDFGEKLMNTPDDKIPKKVLQEIFSENSMINNAINSSESTIKLDSSIESGKNSILSSEDDSICIIYDGPQISNKKELKKNPILEPSQSDQSAKSSTQIKQNLNESNDIKIVFETTNNKPKKVDFKNQNHKVVKNQKQTPNNDPSNDISEFCFEIPKTLCGFLIGTKGSFISNIIKKSNASIDIRDHPTILNMSLCRIKGHQNEIDKAISIIRKRFPSKKYPQITLMPINPKLITIEPIPQNSSLVLAEGVNVEVLLSNFETPDHLFLQQPTHPTFNLLQRLNDYMISTYEFNETPSVEPTIGIICAVQHEDGWYRAIVTDINADSCVVKLLDYGGFVEVSKTSLRQVKRDYMSVPFQSTECFLSNIQPVDGVWSQESIDYFNQITQKQFLQAYIIDYTPERIPLIFLYRIVDNQLININEELCMRCYAIWVK